MKWSTIPEVALKTQSTYFDILDNTCISGIMHILPL